MKRFLMLALVVFLVAPVKALADETPKTIADDPAGAWEKFSGLIKQLDPQPEGFWNLEDNEWHAAFSAALFNVKSEELQLGSVRAGYALDKILYVGPRISPIGLAKRYAPSVTNRLPISMIDFLEEKAKIGLGVGYDFDDSEEAYGVTFTVKTTF